MFALGLWLRAYLHAKAAFEVVCAAREETVSVPKITFDKWEGNIILGKQRNKKIIFSNKTSLN